MQKTPRQLARAFYHGELDWASYRILRRELIDRLTGTGVSDPAGSNAGQPIEKGDTVPNFRARQPNIRVSGKPAVLNKSLLIIAAFLAVLVLLILLYGRG